MGDQAIRDLTERLLAAFNSGDVEGMVSLYEPGAVFIAEDGRQVRGKDALREMLSEFFAMDPTLQFENSVAIEVGDLVVDNTRWTMTATSPEGTPVTMGGEGYGVARRQSDGSLKIVVDSPWGTAALD